MPPAESAKLHAHLVGDVRTMITHAGDMSNLILESDLDSYHLMDALVVVPPPRWAPSRDFSQTNSKRPPFMA